MSERTAKTSTHCASSQEVVHVFGSYGDPSDLATWPRFVKTIATTWGVHATTQRLWSVSGRGVSRQRLDALSELSPLGFGDVARREGSFSVRPMSKLVIAVGDMALGQQPVIIDADQRIELYAASLAVAILAPVAVERASSRQLVPAGELAVDDLVGARILPVEPGSIFRDAILTTYLYATDNEDGVAEIPRGAVSLEVIPRQADVGEWLWTVGDPSIGGFVIGTFATTGPHRVPAASHLVVTSGAARFYTLRWTIRA